MSQLAGYCFICFGIWLLVLIWFKFLCFLGIQSNFTHTEFDLYHVVNQILDMITRYLHVDYEFWILEMTKARSGRALHVIWLDCAILLSLLSALTTIRLLYFLL